jgi:hypothetical protein
VVSPGQRVTVGAVKPPLMTVAATTAGSSGVYRGKGNAFLFEVDVFKMLPDRGGDYDCVTPAGLVDCALYEGVFLCGAGIVNRRLDYVLRVEMHGVCI